MNNNAEVTDQLKQVSSGLLCMSESEYPFECFQWKLPEQQTLTPEKVLQETGNSPDTPIEVIGIDDFFEVATTEQEWHNLEEKETVQKYKHLLEFLKQNLKDIKVYRLGSRKIDVYIVGKTPSGDWAGLSTQVVET